MTDRRTLLADAAIAVLAREGARGLTHHAVDDEAGIARGSTSYYCRTRAGLLSLTLRRVVALDLEDIRALAGGDDPARDLAALVTHWLGPARPRTVARLELFLVASREPELQAELEETTRAFAALTSQAMDPVATFSMVEGLLLTHVRLGRPAPSQEELTATIARSLHL